MLLTHAVRIQSIGLHHYAILPPKTYPSMQNSLIQIHSLKLLGPSLLSLDSLPPLSYFPSSLSSLQ